MTVAETKWEPKQTCPVADDSMLPHTGIPLLTLADAPADKPVTSKSVKCIQFEHTL